LAIAPPDTLNDPMLLRVPPASLRAVTDYAAKLATKGVPIEGVVTKIKFDPAEATPKLQLSPVGFLSEENYALALETAKTTQCKQIIGSVAVRQEKPADDKASEQAGDEEQASEEKPPKETKPPKAEKAAKATPATSRASELAAKLRKSAESEDTDD